MRRLTEDKNRFINKIAAFFKSPGGMEEVQGEYMLMDLCNDIGNELNINIDFNTQWPTWDVITKFANTTKTNVDWNLIDSGYDKYMANLDMRFRWPNEAEAWINEVKKLYKAYFSAKLTKNSKGRKNPKSFFKDEESFTIVGENDDWLFVAVHNYKAAKFCDSFKLGGAGAKWCIGWDQSEEYWYRYTERDNSHFVLAYNKKEWATDTVKYMIQIELDEYERLNVKAWPQNDDPNETLSEGECYEKFDIDEYEGKVLTFMKWWEIANPKVAIHPTFDLHDIMEGKKVEIHIEEPAIKLKATPIVGGRLNIFDIPRLVEDHTSRVRLEEICYDGNDLTGLPNKVVVIENCRFMPPSEEDVKIWKEAPYEIQKVVFKNLDAISIDNLWIDFRYASLEFQNCKNIYIGTLYSSRVPDPDIDVWNEDMVSSNFIHACDVNDIPIMATGNSGPIKIAAMYITPGRYSVMDYHSQRVGGYDDSLFFYFMEDYNENRRQVMNSSCLINMISPNTKTLKNNGLPSGAEKHADLENKILYLDEFIEIPTDKKDGCVKVFNLPAGWKADYRGHPDLKIKCYNSGRNEAMFKEAGWKVEEGRIHHRLVEDKSRFVDRIRDYFGDLCYNSDGNYIDEVNILKKEVADILEKDNSDFTLPTYEALRAFVNSQSIDKYKIDWNKIRDMDTVTLGSKAQKDMHDEIVKIYVAFYTQETHNANKKSKRTMFNDKNNFIILDENDDWLFVGMLSYEACKFADSFQCGGAGAKWCIGWERSQEYWRKYTFRDKDRFVLAYNKNTYGSQDNQKYMLQLSPSAKDYNGNVIKVSVTSWVQSDNPSDVFYDDSTCNTFDITKDQFLEWYSKLWELVKSPYVTKLPIDDVMSGHSVTLDTNERSVRVAPFTSQEIDMYEVVTKVDCTAAGNSIREFVFDANEMGTNVITLRTLKMSPENSTENHQMDDSYIGAKLVFMNFDKVEIGTLIMNEDYSDLTFQQCGMVHIKRAIVPRCYGATDDWNNSVRNGNYYNAIRHADCNLYTDDFSSIKIDSVYATPTRFGMFDVPEESKTMVYYSRSRILGQVLDHGDKVFIRKLVNTSGEDGIERVGKRLFIDLRNFKFDDSENENFPGAFDCKNRIVHLDKIFEISGDLDDVLSSRVSVLNVRIGWVVEWEGLAEANIKLKYQYCGELLNNTNEERIMAKKPMTEGYAAQAKKIKEKKASKYGEYSAAPIMSHGFSKEDYCLQNDVDYSEIDNFDDEYGFFRPEHEGSSWQKFTKLCADYGEQLDKAFEDESDDMAKQNAKARADAIATTKNLLKSGERCRIKVGKKIVK